jgi:hypothetical protein
VAEPHLPVRICSFDCNATWISIARLDLMPAKAARAELNCTFHLWLLQFDIPGFDDRLKSRADLLNHCCELIGRGHVGTMESVFNLAFISGVTTTFPISSASLETVARGRPGGP